MSNHTLTKITHNLLQETLTLARFENKNFFTLLLKCRQLNQFSMHAPTVITSNPIIQRHYICVMLKMDQFFCRNIL